MGGSHTWTKTCLSLATGELSSGLRHTGLLGFLQDNPLVPIALTSGLVLSLGIIPYTVFLSHQHYECPGWAYGCTLFTGKLGTIQGVVTLIYTVGLTCLAYACWALAVVSLWPLLCRQPLTLRQIDIYLAISRGSIPSILAALAIVRRYTTLLFIVWSFLVTLTTLSAGPVVGFVLDQPYLVTAYAGEMFVGGGTGLPWTQLNPPQTVDVALAGLYDLWSSGFSNESMPTYRNWLVDRDMLQSRGNFTAKAVRVQKSVSCNGARLNQTTRPPFVTLFDKYRQLYFNTNVATDLNASRPIQGQSSDFVAILNMARISVWAQDVTFISVNRTRTTLIFALPGNRIEGSYITNLTGHTAKYHSFISAVACDVDVEFVDDILVVGDGGLSTSDPGQQQQPQQLPVLSSIDELHSWYSNTTNGHQELALHVSTAPIQCGSSVNGQQPLFAPLADNSSATALVPSRASEGNLTWHFNIDQITHLIDVSVGAYLLYTSWAYRDRRVLMDFTVFANRMSPIRNVLLGAPVAVLLIIWFILACWTSKLHKECKMPFMRMCETAEILRACRTGGTHDAGGDVEYYADDVRLHCRVTQDGCPCLRSDMPEA